MVFSLEIDSSCKFFSLCQIQHNKQETEFWMRPQPFRPRGGPMSIQRMPHPSSALPGTSPSPGSSMSPVPFPYMQVPTLSATDRSLYQPGYQSAMAGFQAHLAAGSRWQAGVTTDHASLPRPSRSSQESAPVSSPPVRPVAIPASLPTLSRKPEGSSENKQPDLTCPKCSKEFSESQQAELISHINSCTD